MRWKHFNSSMLDCGKVAYIDDQQHETDSKRNSEDILISHCFIKTSWRFQTEAFASLD